MSPEHLRCIFCARVQATDGVLLTGVSVSGPNAFAKGIAPKGGENLPLPGGARLIPGGIPQSVTLLEREDGTRLHSLTIDGDGCRFGLLPDEDIAQNALLNTQSKDIESLRATVDAQAKALDVVRMAISAATPLRKDVSTDESEASIDADGTNLKFSGGDCVGVDFCAMATVTDLLVKALGI